MRQLMYQLMIRQVAMAQFYYGDCTAEREELLKDVTFEDVERELEAMK